jgi:hypothetical protein
MNVYTLLLFPAGKYAIAVEILGKVTKEKRLPIKPMLNVLQDWFGDRISDEIGMRLAYEVRQQ